MSPRNVEAGSLCCAAHVRPSVPSLSHCAQALRTRRTKLCADACKDCDHCRNPQRRRPLRRLSRTGTCPQLPRPRSRRRRWPASCRQSRWRSAPHRSPSAAGPQASTAPAAARTVQRRSPTSPWGGHFLRRSPPSAPQRHPPAWAVPRTHAPRTGGRLAAPPRSRPLRACTAGPGPHTSCTRPWPQRGAAWSAALRGSALPPCTQGAAQSGLGCRASGRGSRAGFAEAPAPRKQAPPAPRRGAPSHTRQTARPRTVPQPLPRPASTRQGARAHS